MNNLTITQVSKLYDITPRMLRHYEKIGLIYSVRKEEYAYRTYDEVAQRRIQQILILRKLRIPLGQISVILQDDDKRKSLQILEDNILALNEEIAALDKIRSLLQMFMKRLEISHACNFSSSLLDDIEIAKAVQTLVLSKNNLKEHINMNELNKAEETLSKTLCVRYVLLPPCTVATYHYIGETPEENAGAILDKFVRENKLYEIKPDARMFGFNHPNPNVRADGVYGYEVWVTVPDNMEIPKPLVKKTFDGGLYAAFTINFPEFQYWNNLQKWVEENPVYTANYSALGDEIMGGCLEEHLNWVYASCMGWPENGIDGQLDLLLPIKKK
ncbi:MAG: effector binding domain-containing protein [Lachnospiraceae bacterium]|jgi:Predicted transcriptional regulators